MTDPSAGHDLFTAMRAAQATNPASLFDDLAEQMLGDPATRARYLADVARTEALQAGGELLAGLIADAMHHNGGAASALAALMTDDEGKTK